MNKRIFVAIAVAFLLPMALSGCLIIDDPVLSQTGSNQLPVIGFGAIHSPNGIQQHAPFEYDIYGKGYDPDGYIVSWVIRVDGHTFRIGNNQNTDRMADESEMITYQFPGVGWYPISVTAFDNDGGSTTFVPAPDGLWRIER